MEDTSDRRKRYLVRPSYFFEAKHCNDVFLNLGLDYKGKIFKKGLSPELYANPLQTPMYQILEGLITSILENTKTIKKWFSIAHDRNNMNIN